CRPRAARPGAGRGRGAGGPGRRPADPSGAAPAARPLPGGILAAGVRRAELCRDRGAVRQDRELGAGDLSPRPGQAEGGTDMKMPCYLVRDLLPLYHDGVCGEETAADVREHLKGCESCRAALAELDADTGAEA